MGGRGPARATASTVPAPPEGAPAVIGGITDGCSFGWGDWYRTNERIWMYRFPSTT